MGFVCYLSGVLKYGRIDFALGENEVRKKEMGMRQEEDKKQTFLREKDETGDGCRDFLRK